MANPAPNEHPIAALLAQRWSPRAFDPKPVDGATLASLFEAARWAPSSFNEQPWSFLVATQDDAEAFGAMAGCLVEANRAWAQNAWVLAIGVAGTRFARNDKPNAHARHDLGMAIMSLALQAVEENLVTHMMGGFDADAARTVYGIPETHEAVTAIAIGHAGDPSTLPEQLQGMETAPRSRKPMEEFVYTGSFGNAAGFA